MDQDQREIRRKRRILERARKTGNIIKTCRYFGVSRSTFYLWKRAYQAGGEQGLVRKKPMPHQMPNQTPEEVVDKEPQLFRIAAAVLMAGGLAVMVLSAQDDLDAIGKLLTKETSPRSLASGSSTLSGRVSSRTKPGAGSRARASTARRTIQGYEAMHMIRKGQARGVSGIGCSATD